MADRKLPRVPLWQLIGALTGVLAVGSVATIAGAGRPPEGAWELTLTFLPMMISGAATLILWRRSKAADAAAPVASPVDDAAGPAGVLGSARGDDVPAAREPGTERPASPLLDAAPRAGDVYVGRVVTGPNAGRMALVAAVASASASDVEGAPPELRAGFVEVERSGSPAPETDVEASLAPLRREGLEDLFSGQAIEWYSGPARELALSRLRRD